jgi:transposase-like protein
MEHLFLLRRQAHELKMRQIVEEITFGRHTIESAMSKYQVLTRSTVTKWLERVRQEEQARTQAMENTSKKPPTTLVEQVVQHADALLEQAELQVLYYKNVIRVAEQELGLSIEKKSATK